MGNALVAALITLLQQSLHWALFLAGRLGILALWLFWPIWILALVLGWCFASAESAQAGWFSWLWGDSDHTDSIQRLEAAYSGYGDSGCIDGTQYRDAAG